MRVFISYAAEQRDLAEQVSLALVGAGHETFFDKDDLRPAREYHAAIRDEVQASDVVVFLISTASVEPHSYTLTELKYAKDRWPHPAGHVLPVLTEEVPWDQVPHYLRAVTVLTPEGNVAAEVLHALDGMRPIAPTPDAAVPQRPTITRPRILATLGLAAIAVAVVLYVRAVPSPSTEARPPATVLPVAGPTTTALDDMRCARAGAKNPILDRAAGLRPPTFTVDAATHVLMSNGKPVAIVPAANLGKLEAPRLVMAHFTAAPAASVTKLFEDGRVPASAHLLIARDGSVTQLVPFDFGADHAGASRWGSLNGLNKYSIGIELENWGSLRRDDGMWRAPSGASIPADQVAVVAGANGEVGWQRYDDAQLRAFFEITCALRHAYPSLEALVGHDEVSGGRKSDPGPAFPMAFMRKRLFPDQAN